MSKPKISKKAKYKAVIIGAGRIGSGFDKPGSRDILTHARAYEDNRYMELSGIYDIDQEVSQKASRKWGCRSFVDFKEIKQAKPDIVSICTPDKTHYECLKLVAGIKPKLVICEKPITSNLKETEAIINLYKKSGIPVLINYTRRFNKIFQKLKKEIVRKKYGKILSGSGIYTNGILHNGSHMVDFSSYLLGDIIDIKTIKKIENYDNRDDANISGFIKFSKCDQFYIIGNNSKKYSIFEMDFLFEKARIKLLDEGYYLSVSKIINDPVFKGYKCLSKPSITETGLNQSLKILMENAINHLSKKTPLICGLNEASMAQKVCFKFSNRKI